MKKKKFRELKKAREEVIIADFKELKKVLFEDKKPKKSKEKKVK